MIDAPIADAIRNLDDALREGRAATQAFRAAQDSLPPLGSEDPDAARKATAIRDSKAQRNIDRALDRLVRAMGGRE